MRKKSVLILVNHDVVIYNFRLELVERLLANGYDVHISSPYGERIEDLIVLGAVYHKIDINRHGMNLNDELRIFHAYIKLITVTKPVIVLGYTIKPNIYGAMAARRAHIPFIANITGLGTAVESGGIRQHLIILLYKSAFTNVQRIYFQNKENQIFFRKHRIAVNRHKLIPGSGVNLQRFAVQEFPDCGDGKSGVPIKFAFISRIMKEKGIEEYLTAAKAVKKKYPFTEFHICGFCEDEYDGNLKEMNASGIIVYHGMIRDINSLMAQMHCIVHPSYYPEGLSNVLLEACACGRAIITTDRSGCREAVRDGMNGYMVAVKDVKALVKAIEKFIRLPKKDKARMGLCGRNLAEKKFNRQIVVNAYMKEIQLAECRMAERMKF